MSASRSSVVSRLSRTILAAGLVAATALVGVTARPVAADTYQRISGEGSSWAANAIDAMRVNVRQFGMTVDYNPSGSTAGRKNFLNGTVDFAASDIPFVFHPEVIKMLYPNSIASVGEGTSFQPVTYRGEWHWQNILHATDNPDGTIGKFRGIFTMGTEPLFADFGYRIRHARCRNQTAFYAACS